MCGSLLEISRWQDKQGDKYRHSAVRFIREAVGLPEGKLSVPRQRQGPHTKRGPEQREGGGRTVRGRRQPWRGRNIVPLFCF